MGYTGITHPNPASGEEAILPYGYKPSLAMGIVGIVTFLAAGGPHLYWLFTKRGVRSVHGLFFFVAVIEALGYGGRLYSNTHEWSGMGFLIGVVLVQIATILVTAALYKSIQRALKYTPGGQSLCPMRARSVVALFTVLDAVWVVLQMAGEYYIAVAGTDNITGDTPTFGSSTADLLFIAGNVLQAITIIIVSAFVLVIIKRGKRALANADPNDQYPVLMPLLNQILISFGIFFVRLIMRIARGAQGVYGNAWSHEVYFGVFEFLPIIAILILWDARPLWKFLFPFGHKHGEGAHTRDAEPGPLPPAELHKDAKA